MRFDATVANCHNRREPSPAVRRKPSLTLVCCNPRRPTGAYDVQGGTSVAGGRKPEAADNADRILTITYPDNRTLTYTRDILGRLTQASFPVNGTPTVLTQNRTYRADGLLSTQTLGSGLAESKTYDQQGRMTQWVIGGETRTYTYDANSNVQTRTTPTESRTYVYDPEDRLTEDRITAGTGTTQTLVYDLNGNRTKLNTTAYLYTANSNRLTKVGTKTLTLDPAGNTTKDNLNYNYTYDAAGRLREARSGTTLKGTYTYNHRHLRTRKVAGSTTTVYHYDLDGRLIAETTSTGTLTRAYVHDDEAPIAQVTKTTTDTLAYVHTDHLGTPRLATNPARSTVWRYDGNAFGDTLPTGTITVNLRFPGQYYDTETKLHYNWHRYYDPRIGRYVTSDPIGLEAGTNTYAYVSSNPLINSDAEGLLGSGGNAAGNKIWRELTNTYNEMQKQQIKGSDQFFHCLAACKATKASGAPDLVRSIMNEKEYIRDLPMGLLGIGGNRERKSLKEMLEDIRRDKAANEFGIQCPTEVDCNKRCQPMIDAMKRFPKSQQLLRERYPPR